MIVDPQPIVLQGLKSVFGAEQDFDVVASSSDGTSCLETIRKLRPDVALLADTLPDLTVSELLAIAKAEKLPTRLVFFAEFDTDRDLTAAIAAGACSVISKYASPDTMLRSLRLMTKRFAAPEQSYPWPTGKEADGGKIEKMLELLTHRERQIARLVSEGKSNKEIARQLNVSHGTVKVHLYNIFQKLEITNRTVLATLALLQRTSGFGTLALAFLAVAIADELKAAEANDMLPNDDGIGHAGQHAEYEPWKKAILRHLIVWESAETPPLTQRDVLARVSQVTNPAVAMEAQRAAEQSGGAKLWKDYGPVGSSTPNLPALLLRGTSDTQIGGAPTLEDLFPRLASNPMSAQGGYSTFATLAGALIYALHDPHLAAQTHGTGQASLDSFLAVTGENATARVAAITNADAHHVDNSATGFLAHDSRLPSASVVTGNEGVAGDDARSQMGDGAVVDKFQKPLGLLVSGHDAGVGGDRSDHLTGGNVDEDVAHRSPIDSNSTSSESGFDFASGASRINFAAFGALAWLHMTAASKSIPPHTLAWIYNSASNETIVYVNPTDHALDVGDRGLVEIHLQGIVSIAESDLAGQPEGTAVAITLEQLEEALASAVATDETVSSTDNVHAIGGAGESTVETAGVWSIRADDGLRFQFGQTRTGPGASTRFGTVTSDSADATQESEGASAVSAHASSIALAHSATVTAAENLTFKSEAINAGTGVSSTGLNEIVQPGVATADSAGRGNSEHASEQGSEKAATEATEAESKAGNGVGNDKKTAEAADVDHGNSEHDSHSPSANGPKAADSVEPDVATAAGAGRGNLQHASEPGSAKAAATEATEAESAPGNGVGNDKKTAEAAFVDHGNSGHDSHSPSANAPEAADSVEPDVATAAGAGRGNLQHASEPGSAKAAATEAAEADAKPGNGLGNEKKTAEAADEDRDNSAHDLHPSSANGPKAAEAVEPDVATADSASHGNSDHASEPESAKAAVTELTGADSAPGNGVGNDKKAAEAADVDHGNSAHDLHPNSANGPKAAEAVEPDVATADSASHGNSDHASEPESAKAAATELAEADTTPGNGVGNDKKAAEAADVDHGNSAHDLHPNSANGPKAAEVVEPGVATADSAGRGNSEHASEPESAKAVAAELAEADATPGNGVGNDKKAAEAADVDHGNSDHVSEPGSAKAAATELAEADTTPGNGVGNDKAAEATDVDHGNSGHDSHSPSANAPEAAEIVEPSVATGGNAGGGNSQQAAQSAAIASEAVQPAKAASETGGPDQELVFRFDSVATPSTLVAVVELKELDDPHVPPGLDKHLEIIVQITSSALDDHAANHGNSGSHPAIAHGAHDLLI
ncbi:DNA-binding NarL/FixJ family response regulator [Bradyrhizobium sp. cir1]|uniref:LuxR C-terminal-related transcriptional regulator n=1 Tax=Bradyrhizobium sp. cir1 TaxID=1445730 RepID=UPI00184036F4|nr:LuxR C-terminal-related transcriptional regulator [Bradyrhizobium sp. cir1]MBB4371667.1 DNA-binding NarL/FixJ family response regulator [Bradyrhizobium sp. cir1]